MTDPKRGEGARIPPQRRSLQQRFGPYTKARDGKKTIRRLLALYMQWKGELIRIALLTLLSTGASLAAPYLLGLAVDCFHLEDGSVDAGRLTFLACLLGGCYLAQWLGNLGRRGRMEIVSQRMVQRVRQDFFEKLGRLPLSFFDGRSDGDLMSRLMNDADNISTVAAETITQLFSSLLTLAGALILMLSLSPLLTLTALATVPVVTLLTRLISRRSRRLYREQAKATGAMNGLVEESIRNGRIVKIFCRQEEALRSFDQANVSLRDSSVKAQICAGFLSPLVNMVNNLGFALIACVGGLLSLRGQVRVGLVVSFLDYSRQLGRPLNSIAALFSSIQQAVAGAERLFEILDEAEQEPDSPDAAVCRDIRGDVSFDRVTFRYGPADASPPVLEDVTFTVKAGEVAAFIGETGAGKTTLVQLLLRFYEPESGCIRLDGLPLRCYTRASLNRCFSVVPQDTAFFSGTVLENLLYARPEATEEEAIQAAKLAHAHDFIIRLPQGYRTALSGAAEEFSQGERQLLAIARSMIADAPIRILDEATSSVDPATEKRIQQAMLSLTKGHTCFLIAHRLSTVRQADRVFVVGERGILESGSPTELLARRGVYWHMVNTARA